MGISEKEYDKQYDELLRWIENNTQAFPDDSEKAKRDRIAKAKVDKIFFAKTYFPHYIEDEFAPVHKELFLLADVMNKPIALAGAREVIAKSTIISFFDEMHKTCFKLNRFTVFICDTLETATSEFLFPLRAELEANQRLINDFGDQKTTYWGMSDFLTKSGKRFLALGPKMGTKGKRNKGIRPDRIIFEDMENMNSSKKKSIITRKLKWIDRDVMKAVNSKKWQFIFIGNYFSKKTIIHQLLTSETYSHWIRKIFPAMVEVGGKLKSVWESRFPTKMLLKEQQEDPATFRTERMQKPDDEEAIFKEEYFKWVNENEVPKHLPVVTYIDPSAGKGEEHCFKAIIVLATDKEKADYYVLHAWIRKTSKWASVERHIQLSQKFHSLFDGIESNGYQLTLKEDYEMIEQRIGKRIGLKMINNRLPKDTRIASMQSPIERGHFYFVRGSDMQMLVDQLIDFPDGEFVDGADALAGAKDVSDTFVLRKTNKVGVKVLG